LCRQADHVLQFHPPKESGMLFHSTLLDSAIAVEKSNWFTINCHDENNANTLTSFLELRFVDMVDLYMQGWLLGII